MRTAAFVAALVAGVAAAPQAVTSAIAPQETTPAGCKTSFTGKFQVTVEPLTKRDSVPLEITLKDGILTDAQGRTGYIASNNQFQFDGPAQAGAIYTAGWSVCSNGSLALGNSAIFYQCLSGTFYNLYDENTAAQCSPVFLYALSDAATTGAQAVASDGQVTGASATTGVAHTVICQIGDGQIQQNTCITTATPVAEATDGQITAPKATGPAITQIPDGQIQAPGTTSSAPAVTPPVIAAPTGNTITQISDGQIQVPTGSNSTIATRTPSAASTTGAVGTSAAASGSSPASTFTGAAAPTLRAELFGLVAGIAALAVL